LRASQTNKPSDLDEISELAASALQELSVKKRDLAPDPKAGLSWDTQGFLPPNKGNDDSGPEVTDRSTGTPTSRHMNGSIAVGIVIVGGTLAAYQFSAANNAKVISECVEGLGFLANAEPRAKIRFVYDIRILTVSVAAGPTTSYESAEAPWRNAALAAMGYPAERASSTKYAEDLQASKNTRWSYVAYFTKYPLNWFAYAGAEKVVMHYDNDGWGTDLINKVFAHETCHIFGAADEYGSCSCGGSHGELGIPNNNCVNCGGAHVECLMETNSLTICNWSRKQIGWDISLFPQGVTTLQQGAYNLKHKLNNRYLDAHGEGDFTAVTRPKQNNSSQEWIFKPIGTVYEIIQKNTGRYLDAHNSGDFVAVTRPDQDNDSQRWIAIPESAGSKTYTLRQLHSLRYLDAHEETENDYRGVTRPPQNNNSQKWNFSSEGVNQFRLQHKVNNRYLDAHEDATKDFAIVTRGIQENDSQRWLFKTVGGVYTIQQANNKRYLDAHDNAGSDYRGVTRTSQNDDSQKWIVMPKGGNVYSIRQLMNGRFLDAHEDESKDFAAVTREEQQNTSQEWIISLT
ncbi:MAG: hypothetical protein EOO02_02020, partial [Chitinophagaceae bacterium]